MEASFPLEAIDFMEARRIGGKVFAYYNWGGYLHLRTGGRLQVYIDGRADTVFDAKTYTEYLSVLLQKPGWSDVIEGSGAEWVLWPTYDPDIAKRLEESGRWRMVHADAVAQLLARRDVVFIPDAKP